MKYYLIILVVMASFIISCEDDSSYYQAPTVQELEIIVKGNSLTLLEAVELFAIDNYGKYPESVDSDTTATGKILIDYLPGGERLINPFTGIKDQPVDSIPSSPGEIGYYKYQYEGDYDTFYFNVYFIQGYGVNSIIVEHDNIEKTEALVVADCLELQRAVEEWILYDDRYPCSASDSNWNGDSVLDYLPDGHLMENHVTLYYTEPSIMDGTAVLPGEISYQCKVKNGMSVGYTITAIGVEQGITIFQISVN